MTLISYEDKTVNLNRISWFYKHYYNERYQIVFITNRDSTEFSFEKEKDRDKCYENILNNNSCIKFKNDE